MTRHTNSSIFTRAGTIKSFTRKKLQMWPFLWSEFLEETNSKSEIDIHPIFTFSDSLVKHNVSGLINII